MTEDFIDYLVSRFEFIILILAIVSTTLDFSTFNFCFEFSSDIKAGLFGIIFIVAIDSITFDLLTRNDSFSSIEEFNIRIKFMTLDFSAGNEGFDLSDSCGNLFFTDCSTCKFCFEISEFSSDIKVSEFGIIMVCSNQIS